MSSMPKMHTADSVHNVRAIKVKNLIAPEYFIFPCAIGAIKQPENRLKSHPELEDVANDGQRELEPFDFPSLMSEDELSEFAKGHDYYFGPHGDDAP